MGQSILLHMLFYNVIHADPDAPIPRIVGKDVACLLMNRLAELAKARNARVIVLAQPQAASYPPEDGVVKDHLLDCARRRGLATVDLFPVIEHLPPPPRAQLFQGHMTPEGNAVVARELVHALSR
jgi:hypothetical protein